jgi:hypothetical protein
MSMSTGTLANVPAETAAEVGQHVALGDEAKALLQDGLAPGAYLNLLIEKGQFLDAVRFLAHALPKREAVWWACQCGRLVAGASLTPEVANAFETAEDWATHPDEDIRRAAQRAYEPATLQTPAGLAALAAFVSEGSLSHPGLPVVEPPPFATAQMVAGAVLIAAVLTEPEKAPEKYRKFLALGIEIANGQKRWKEGTR